MITQSTSSKLYHVFALLALILSLISACWLYYIGENNNANFIFLFGFIITTLEMVFGIEKDLYGKEKKKK